jgi:hypothetical protein
VKREALDDVEQQKAHIDVLKDPRLGDEGSEFPALGRYSTVPHRPLSGSGGQIGANSCPHSIDFRTFYNKK